MSFHDLVTLIGFTNLKAFWGLVIFAASILIEVTPLKINPWSSLIKWIGKNFNDKLNKSIDSKVDALGEKLSEKDRELSKKIDDISEKVDTLNNSFRQHITESERKNLQDTRRDILDYCNSCMNGRKHTKEEFDFVISECDYYEKYIQDHDLKNGVIEAAIREIRRLYDKCIQEHSFLSEPE